MESFFENFRKPQDFAQLLCQGEKEVRGRWNQDNRGASKVGRRFPTSINYGLTKYEWRNSRGKMEETVHELGLSTFAFTNQNMTNPDAEITAGDVRVSWRKEGILAASP